MTIWGLIENEKVIIKIALHEKNNGNTFVFTYGYCH